MYDMNDLFNSRDVVGCKLNQIIGSHKYTKSNVCTGAGISRPTLDKLLNGEVTNKTNFEKHISKLLAFLSLTPSELMGGIANPFTDSKTLRDARHLAVLRGGHLRQLQFFAVHQWKVHIVGSIVEDRGGVHHATF